MNFPDWLQKVGMVMPTAMIADLVRAPLLGATDPHALPVAVSVAGCAGYFVVAVALGARFFRWR
jgi:ABC-type polysaccharide/polyol phosphate export permease